MAYILYTIYSKGENMNNNLKKIEKELRSFAKRCKEIVSLHGKGAICCDERCHLCLQS